MKKLLFFLLLPFIVFARTVPLPFENVYLPRGIDANDNAEVLLTGYLPDLCYKNVKVNKRIDRQTKTVYIELLSDYAPAQMCTEVLLPYEEVLSLGKLEEGSYTVYVNEFFKEHTPMTFQVSRPETKKVDNFIYADVLDVVQRQGNYYVVAVIPSTCLEFVDVKTIFNGTDTLSVLPILRKNNDRCYSRSTVHRFPINLSDYELPAKFLVHVRSSGGKSLNKIMSKYFTLD